MVNDKPHSRISLYFAQHIHNNCTNIPHCYIQLCFVDALHYESEWLVNVHRLLCLKTYIYYVYYLKSITGI